MPAFTQSGVRQPRAFVQISGMNIPLTSAGVTKTSKRTADRFNAGLPLDSTLPFGLDEVWWASRDSLQVSVLLSAYSGDTPTVMITGAADEIEIDWTGRTISLSGRDKSASLADNKRSKKYNNQSVADVVKDIAGLNGLNPVVTGATDKAGKTYDDDSVLTLFNKSDFETLSDLAEDLDYRWYVDGNDLHFEPAASNKAVYPLVYQPPSSSNYEGANFTHLVTRRNLAASKTVKATVKSYHPKTQQLSTYTAEAPARKASFPMNSPSRS